MNLRLTLVIPVRTDNKIVFLKAIFEEKTILVYSQKTSINRYFGLNNLLG